MMNQLNLFSSLETTTENGSADLQGISPDAVESIYRNRTNPLARQWKEVNWQPGIGQPAHMAKGVGYDLERKRRQCISGTLVYVLAINEDTHEALVVRPGLPSQEGDNSRWLIYDLFDLLPVDVDDPDMVKAISGRRPVNSPFEPVWYQALAPHHFTRNTDIGFFPKKK